MDKVTLFKSETSSIKISIELYFNEQQALILDGYDIGKTVEEYMGDSDYEYSYTIAATEVSKLYPLFNIVLDDKPALLRAIQQQFGCNEAYSLFGKFMDEHQIQYTAFTWR